MYSLDILVSQFGYTFIDNSYRFIPNFLLVKNILNICISFLIWILFGYGLAFGNSFTGLIGTSKFGTLINQEYENCINFWIKGLFITNILNTSMLNSMKIECFIILNLFIFIFLFPVLTHWIYSTKGWLYNLGIIQSNVYLFYIGGLYSLISNICSSKIFNNVHINYNIFILGNLLIILGIINLNLNYNSEPYLLLINLLISGSISAMTSVICKKYIMKTNEILTLINGFLIGIITTGNSSYNSFGSILTGLISSCIYIFSSYFLVKSKIIDPFEIISVNFFGGLWGMFAPCFFDKNIGIVFTGNLSIFVPQFVSLLSITIFNIIFFSVLFIILQKYDLHTRDEFNNFEN